MKKIEAIGNLYGTSILIAFWLPSWPSNRITAVKLLKKDAIYQIKKLEIFFFYSLWINLVFLTLLKAYSISNASAVCSF